MNFTVSRLVSQSARRQGSRLRPGVTHDRLLQTGRGGGRRPGASLSARCPLRAQAVRAPRRRSRTWRRSRPGRFGGVVAGRDGRAGRRRDGFGARRDDGGRRHRPRAAGSSSARCRPGPIWSARISPATSRSRGTGRRSPAERAHVVVDCAATRRGVASSPILAAGVGLPAAGGSEPAPRNRRRHAGRQRSRDAATPADDDHSETAWRLRHARRGVLKDVTLPRDSARRRR